MSQLIADTLAFSPIWTISARLRVALDPISYTPIWLDLVILLKSPLVVVRAIGAS